MHRTRLHYWHGIMALCQLHPCSYVWLNSGSGLMASSRGGSHLPQDGSPSTVATGKELLYGRMDIGDRLGTGSRAEHSKAIKETYMVPGRATIPWFVDGKRNIVRHPRNMRHQQSHVDGLVESILKNSIVSGVRSSPKLMFSAGRQGPMLALGHGTLTDAAYMAFERFPDHPNVKAALETGLEDCERYDDKMPDDIIDWIIHTDNAFHDGLATTWQEILRFVPDIEAGWRAYAKKERITSRMAGENSYEKQAWRWVVKNHEGKLKSWQQFDCTKSLNHYLDKYRIATDFHSFMSSNVDWGNKSMSNDTVILSMHHIAAKIVVNMVLS